MLYQYPLNTLCINPSEKPHLHSAYTNTHILTALCCFATRYMFIRSYRQYFTITHHARILRYWTTGDISILTCTLQASILNRRQILQAPSRHFDTAVLPVPLQQNYNQTDPSFVTRSIIDQYYPSIDLYQATLGPSLKVDRRTCEIQCNY